MQNEFKIKSEINIMYNGLNVMHSDPKIFDGSKIMQNDLT